MLVQSYAQQNQDGVILSFFLTVPSFSGTQLLVCFIDISVLQ